MIICFFPRGDTPPASLSPSEIRTPWLKGQSSSSTKSVLPTVCNTSKKVSLSGFSPSFSRQAVFVLFLDLEAVFERARPDLILKTLVEMKVSGRLLAWVKDFFV